MDKDVLGLMQTKAFFLEIPSFDRVTITWVLVDEDVVKGRKVEDDGAKDRVVEMEGGNGCRNWWCVEGWEFKDERWGLRMKGEGGVVVKGLEEWDVVEVVGIVVSAEATGVGVGDREKDGMEVLGVFVADMGNQTWQDQRMRKNLKVQEQRV